VKGKVLGEEPLPELSPNFLHTKHVPSFQLLQHAPKPDCHHEDGGRILLPITTILGEAQYSGRHTDEATGSKICDSNPGR